MRRKTTIQGEETFCYEKKEWRQFSLEDLEVLPSMVRFYHIIYSVAVSSIVIHSGMDRPGSVLCLTTLPYTYGWVREENEGI